MLERLPGPIVGGQRGKSGTAPLPRGRARRRPHSPQLAFPVFNVGAHVGDGSRWVDS